MQTPVQTSGLGSLTVRVYAFVSERMTDEALELFVDRKIAELMVKNWNRDEPDRAGELRVEPIELNIRRTETRSSVRAEALERSRAARWPPPRAQPRQ